MLLCIGAGIIICLLAAGLYWVLPSSSRTEDLHVQDTAKEVKIAPPSRVVRGLSDNNSFVGGLLPQQLGNFSTLWMTMFLLITGMSFVIGMRSY